MLMDTTMTQKSYDEGYADGKDLQADLVARLERENQELRSLLAQKVIDSTMLTGIETGLGNLTVGLQGGACGIMASAFAEMLYTSGAPNYLEAYFESDNTQYKGLGRIVVTVQRCEGMTPHEKRQQAQRNLASLRQAIANHIEGNLTETYRDHVNGRNVAGELYNDIEGLRALIQSEDWQ